MSLDLRPISIPLQPDGHSDGGTGATQYYPFLHTEMIYYVDSLGGNDAYSGLSEDRPWKTIAKINAATLVPGDVVLFRRNRIWIGTTLMITRSGTAIAPITFDAYGEGTIPIIDGNSMALDTLTATNQSYLTFGNIGCTNSHSAGFFFTNCSNITVIDCESYHNDGDGIIFWTGCHDCRVLRGKYHGTLGNPAIGAGSGIEIADASHDIIIDGAECYDATGYGAYGMTIHGHVASTMPYNITVRNCSFHDNDGYGLLLFKLNPGVETDRNILIENCIIYNNDIYGICVSKGPLVVDYIHDITFRDCIMRNNPDYDVLLVAAHDVLFERCLFHEGGMVRFASVQDIIVYNCTFYLTTFIGRYPLNVGNTEGNTQNVLVRNCIMASADLFCYFINFEVGAITGASVDYNLYYDTGDLTVLTRWVWNGVNVTWANWKLAGQDLHSPVPTNPLFKLPVADMFTLEELSPALNAGIDVGLPYVGTAPDLGAYERGL